MRLILVRHGESLGNAAGVLQGRLDYGLTELGKLQAKLTGGKLATIEAQRIVSSPLLRATETADVIAAAKELDVTTDEGLAEYDIGEGAGLTPPQLREKFPEMVAARLNGQRFTFPGEEGRDHFQQRLVAVLERLRSLEGATVAVAHGGVISAFCHMVVGLDLNRPGAFMVGNCSLTEITQDRAGRLVLASHNDVCHLAGIETMVDRG